MLWRLFKQQKFNLRYVQILKIFLLLAAVTVVLDIGCPIKRVTGFDCPTCGMTRAMLSLLHGDWKGYCIYNKMALPVLLAVLLESYASCYSGKRMLHVLSFIILSANFIFYLFRILTPRLFV